MIKYRAYIKQAKPNILGSLKNGTIDSNGNYSPTQYRNSTVTNDFIKVDRQHTYEFKKIETANLDFYIYEYDSNKTFLESIIHFEIQLGSNVDPNKCAKKYIPNQNVEYIKLQISNSDTTKNACMLLQSTTATLIHDSGSPENKDHLINATLHLEDSAAGTFEFIVHKKHLYYKQKINLWTDTLYITRTYSDGRERIIWDGRAITEEIDSDGNKMYHCEGALSYLNDVRTISNSEHEPNLTIFEFISQYIIDKANSNDAINNRFDRSFYWYKDPDAEYKDYYDAISGATIIIDQGVKYLWASSHESGMKWINDIKESFNSHVKIRYRVYDSPDDDIVCRCLTAVQDFDRKVELPKYESSWRSNGKRINKDLIYYIPNTNPLNVRLALMDFYYVQNDDDLLRHGYIEDISSQNELKQRGLFVEDGILYKKPDEKRYPKMKAIFGLNVFDAKKVTEIKDFASVIIPRGIDITNAAGISSKLLMTTTNAFVEGNFNDPVISGGNAVQGHRDYILRNENSGLEIDYLIDINLIKQYGYVEAVVDFESADTPKKLKEMGTKWFKDLKKQILNLNIEISLSNLNNHIEAQSSDSLADPEYIDIWTQIYASIPELGITEDDPEKYFVSAMDIPLDDYLNTTLTLINKKNMISDNVISAGDIKGSAKGIIDTST